MAEPTSLVDWLVDSLPPAPELKKRVPEDKDTIAILVTEGDNLRSVIIDTILSLRDDYMRAGLPVEVFSLVFDAAWDLHKRGPYHYVFLLERLRKKYADNEIVQQFLKDVNIREEDMLPLYVMYLKRTGQI